MARSNVATMEAAKKPKLTVLEQHIVNLDRRGLVFPPSVDVGWLVDGGCVNSALRNTMDNSERTGLTVDLFELWCDSRRVKEATRVFGNKYVWNRDTELLIAMFLSDDEHASIVVMLDDKAVVEFAEDGIRAASPRLFYVNAIADRDYCANADYFEALGDSLSVTYENARSADGEREPLVIRSVGEKGRIISPPHVSVTIR